MKNKHQRGQMKSLEDPKMGLHQHKNHVQLEFMAQQTDQILLHLDELIASTESLAPNPVKPHKLRHHGERHSLANATHWSEKHWEEAIWRQRERLTGEACALGWDKILCIQSLLVRRKREKGWGEVDVLAMKAKLPVVVEVKSRPSERLLRAVLESAAYGIALKKAWPILRFQWAAEVDGSNDGWCLKSCPLVVAAPTSTYWSKVVPSVGAKRREHQPMDGFWSPFYQLIRALGERGLPIKFLAIEHDGKDVCGLPKITCMKEVIFCESGPPLVP